MFFPILSFIFSLIDSNVSSNFKGFVYIIFLSNSKLTFFFRKKLNNQTLFKGIKFIF